MMKKIVWKMFFYFLGLLLTAKFGKNSHIYTKIYFIFLKNGLK